MRTHTTPRRLRAVVALAVTAVVAATAAPAAQATVVYPKVTSLSSADRTNPLRGQYRWIGTGAVPSTWDSPDLYDRDRTYWGRLEPSKGSYDFSTIENGLNDVGAKHAKFGFRVMAYCPGCWMEQSWRNLPPIAPSYLPKTSSGAPDWNSETFLSGWEKLWAALGARYRNDKRLGYVDVGGFGKYGEWMPAGTITEKSAKRIISAVAKNFPRKHVLLSTVMSYPVSEIAGGRAPYVLKWALDTYPNTGMRSDCLGNSLMQKPEKTAAGDMTSMWKKRPFFTEWCTNGDPTLARKQVRSYHVSSVSSGNLKLTPDTMTSQQLTDYKVLLKQAGYRYASTRAYFSTLRSGKRFRLDLRLRNYGSAPTYDSWSVRLVFRDKNGRLKAVRTLSIDLRGLTPGYKTYTRYRTAPSVPRGTYKVSLQVVDRNGYSPRMELANGARNGDGSYTLGSFTIY
jgi:hypothetical protein